MRLFSRAPLLGVVIPIRLAMAPLFVMVKTLGLLDNIWGVVLVQSAATMPVAVFILTAFLRGVTPNWKKPQRWMAPCRSRSTGASCCR